MGNLDNKKDLQLINNLTDLLSDSSSQTIEEVHEELRMLGIDGKAFSEKVKEKIEAVAENQRVSWISKARKEMSQFSKNNINSQIASNDRQTLLNMLKELVLRMTHAGFEVPQAYFHKFNSSTVDDLKSMIEDLQEIENLSKKKTRDNNG